MHHILASYSQMTSAHILRNSTNQNYYQNFFVFQELALSTPPSPFTPRVSPRCVLPFRKRSMGARLPLQRSRTSSTKFSRTSATLSLPRRFIAIIKSLWALPTGPSSPRCRILYTTITITSTILSIVHYVVLRERERFKQWERQTRREEDLPPPFSSTESFSYF